MVRLSTGWVMANWSAAARIFPASATAKKFTRSSRLSNMPPLQRLKQPDSPYLQMGIPVAIEMCASAMTGLQ